MSSFGDQVYSNIDEDAGAVGSSRCHAMTTHDEQDENVPLRICHLDHSWYY